MLSKIDEIKTLRGELPLEVQDLEDEIAGLSTDVYKRQTLACWIIPTFIFLIIYISFECFFIVLRSNLSHQ